MNRKSDSTYYPIYLSLSGRKCLIVGGGNIAERKYSSLIHTGAMVVVVAPEITGRLERDREKGRISHIRRGYRTSDIKSAFIVIAATDSPDMNKRIAGDAHALQKLINVVDTPSLCNFIVPSVVKRGQLTIAVSTGGASPAMAKAIRKELQRLYGPEFSEYMNVLRDIRSKAMKKMVNKKEREKYLKEVAWALINRERDYFPPAK